MKKKVLSLLMSLSMVFTSIAGMAGLVPQVVAAAEDSKTIVINMGDDKTVDDPMYDSWYAEGSAEKGIKALIAAGKVCINNIAIPATEDAFKTYGFTVNEDSWIVAEDGGTYKVDRTGGLAYEDAALAALKRVSNGNEILLYDQDSDGSIDSINALYVEALIADEVTDNGDGTVTVKRGEPDETLVFEGKDGRVFDDSNAEVTGVTSDTIEAGDMVFIKKTDAGWVIEKAKEVNGILVDGEDHGFYQIDDTKYGDAMRFSRDNIIISNRCGEMVNAHKYFGFLNNDEGLKVSLWFVNTTDESKWGAPAGFTTGGNAAAFLEKAIKIAEGKLEGIKESADGSDVKFGEKWATKQNIADVKAAIDRAKKVLEAKPSDALMDYQVYLLYFALNGSGQDIGAKFAGFNYEGFDNQVQSKPETIVINMGEDKKADDVKYDSLYKEGSAAKGIDALIAKGSVFINGFAIPATEAEFKENGFTVNEQEWLVAEDGGTYKVDRSGGLDYTAAAAAVLGRVSNGNEIRLYDDDQDGYVDRIDADYVEAMIAADVTSETTHDMRGDHTTYTVTRDAVDDSLVFEGKDGRVFDGNTEALSTDSANFDADIKAGDMILFKKTPDGWIVERAKEVNGILVDGQDHEYYQIDEEKYGDAMRFSRDNIIISNRCGELVNAHKYFGFMDNKDGLKVSLWFVNTTDESKWGAPAGFTTGGNAATFLEKAIKIAEDKLEGVVASKDGKDVEFGTKWATQENIDALKASIDRAKKVLEAKPSDALMDYQVYLLYFALNGSGQDIGAKFAGFNYEGFDNQVNDGSKGERFSDVADHSAPFYKPVNWAAANDIIRGFNDGTFGPELTCTREQFVIMIWRYAGKPAAESEVKFSDITADRSSYKAIQWAVENDIIRGFDDGTFQPEGTTTRRQVSIMLWRMNGRPSATAETNFSDVEKSESTYKAIQWGVEAGMLKGYEDGTFKPEDDCLRMHIAIMLYRYARDVDGKDVSF